MSNIKELTMQHHRAAERCGFVKVLLSGKINPDLYATYLWNQYLKYSELEKIAESYNLFDNLQTIKRANKILLDFFELYKDNNIHPYTFTSTLNYIQYIASISDKSRLFAHIYVHHMGDLSGGQMIAKRVPGSGHMYKFIGDIPQLKDTIRSRTADEMAPEAGVCFDYAIQLFEALETVDIPQYID